LAKHGTPFDTASEPPSVPARTPWQHPLLPQLLAAVLDSSKIPIPPAQPPWFSGMATRIPSIGKIPAWMESAVPPDEGRGILGQFSRPVEQPPTDPWGSATAPTARAMPGPLPWQRPVVASFEFPATSAPTIDDDPFARAALRTRQSVQPQGGRSEGAATRVLENYLPHVLGGLATLPQRALDASEELRLTGEYEPAPAVEIASMMVGSPFRPAR
jgi:hypothetical protein